MKIAEIIKQELEEAQHVLAHFLSAEDNITQIERAASLMATSMSNGGKVMSCGNGGSHCDAMHFAEELTGIFRDERKALPALAIADPSHMSCVSNDLGYSQVFGRYIEGLGRKEDVLLAISTSGNSENMITAAQAAKTIGMKVVALTGQDGGKLASLADIEIRVAHFGYADRIQEIHIKVIHILIQLIEKTVS